MKQSGRSQFGFCIVWDHKRTDFKGQQQSLHSSGSTDKIPVQPLTSQHRPVSRLQRGQEIVLIPFWRMLRVPPLMGKVGEGWETENPGGGGHRRKETYPHPSIQSISTLRGRLQKNVLSIYRRVSIWSHWLCPQELPFFLWEKCAHSTGQLV